jgi:signal transduction histidine kinase
LERIVGNTVQLVNANGSNGNECNFEEFVGFTLEQMATFVENNPRHPAAIFVKRSRMTLDDLAALVQRKRDEAQAREPFEVEYAYAAHPDTNMLNVDQIEIFLLLENLLTNAMRAGATEVKITSRKSLLNPAMAEISVEDNGKGFTKRQLKKAKLGEEFSTKNKGNGEVNGVGITHCRFIVEQHGGDFAIDSVKGKGATFSFTLPLSK